VSSNTPTYEIDGGVGVVAPLGGYSISTNGQGDWTVGWQGDALPHNYHGDIFCPDGCLLTATFLNALPGDSVNSVAPNHVGFDGQTDASVRQELDIATGGTNDQPVIFQLFIDGLDARFPSSPYSSFFTSRGATAQADANPFALVITGTTFSDKLKQAPMYTPPPGTKTFTLSAPAPRSGQANTAASQTGQAAAK
jgi:hypothetical protein